MNSRQNNLFHKILQYINKYDVVIYVIFIVMISPFALNYLFHHPDEIHYTNAAIDMIKNGDFITPVYPDGSFRFFKPILTYWTIVLSYLIFGISEFSSRFPGFFTATVFLIFFYRQTNLITGSNAKARIATIILATNPLYIISSTRSIPDIWLMVFLSVAGLGMIRLLMGKGKELNSLAMIYLGGAIAFEAKGLPALAYTGLGISFLIFNPWEKIPVKKLLNVYLIVIAIVIGFGWYALVLLKHGNEAMEVFFDDQVNNRIGAGIFNVVKSFFLITVFFILYTFPWNIFTPKTSFKNFACRIETKFILFWVLLTLIFCLAVSPFYDRYLLPAFPFVSLGLAMIGNFQLKSTAKKVAACFFKTALILFIFLSWVLCLIFNASFTNLFLLLLLTVSVFFVKKISGYYQTLFLITANFLAVFLALSTFVLPNQGKQIANNLSKNNIKNTAILNDSKVAAKIRVNAGLDLDLQEINNYSDYEGFLILKDSDLEKMETGFCIIDTLSVSNNDFNHGKPTNSRAKHTVPSYKNIFSEKYLLIYLL